MAKVSKRELMAKLSCLLLLTMIFMSGVNVAKGGPAPIKTQSKLFQTKPMITSRQLLRDIDLCALEPCKVIDLLGDIYYCDGSACECPEANSNAVGLPCVTNNP